MNWILNIELDIELKNCIFTIKINTKYILYIANKTIDIEYKMYIKYETGH